MFIIIRNDDLCALSDPAKERRVLEVFEKREIPQVISVVPNMSEDPHNCRLNKFHPLNENPQIVALLREYHTKGLLEIAQHGFTHQTNDRHPSQQMDISKVEGIDREWTGYNPASPEGYSEFSGLREKQQWEKIVEGKRLLTEILGAPVRTFVFPWDRINETSLEILGEEGFEHVLCSRHSAVSEKLNLMDYCLRDQEMFQLPGLISDIQRLKTTAVLQVTYHSWMLGDGDINRLEKMFEGLAGLKEVTFIVPQQLAGFVPQAAKLFRLRTKVFNLAEEVNPILGTKIELPGYYPVDLMYYRWIILKARVKKILLKHLGLRRVIQGLKHTG